MSESSHLLYREQLTPPLMWWVVAAILSAMTSLMVLPISKVAGVIVPVVVFIVACVALRTYTPRVAVSDQHFWAGNAHIEREFIGQVTPLGRQASFDERGQQLDARAFLMTRPWVQTLVRIEITDTHDPTPYWLISTRNPLKLAEVLTQSAQSVHTK